MTVRNCNIFQCGLGDGLTHGIYVNAGIRFEMIGGSSTNNNRCHALKSRAWTTIVDGVRLEQAEGVNLDIADGGLLRVRNAHFIKPANAPTAAFMSYAIESTGRGTPTGTIERSRFELRRSRNTIRTNAGTLNFAGDCTWEGQKPEVEGNGRVTGLPR